MKKSTIIKIDIKGFNKMAQAEDPKATSDYISTYYQDIHSIISDHGWRFIKGIGDCVLISANSNTENINKLYEELSKKYNISICYRQCSYVDKQISIGQYSCLDVFGKDINNLFLCDSLTKTLS